MKLRNLFLAGLAVCTMASCSNDDDVNNGPIAEVDASLAFVATSDILKTKATTEGGTTKEDFINKLDVYIFKADGSLANKKTVNAVNDVSVSQVDHILLKVTPGTDLDTPTANTFTAYFLANCDVITATTLSDFEAAVAAKDVNGFEYEATTNYKYLPMAKKVEFGGLRPLVNSQGKYVENWVQNNGDAIAGTAVDKDAHNASVTAPTSYNEVVVERLVARIQVEKIKVDLSAINSSSSFKLTNLALANVHTDVTPKGAVYTKKLWAKGYQGPKYSSKDTVVAPYATEGSYSAAVASLAKSYSYPSALTSYDFNGQQVADKFISYVYPNAGDDTFDFTMGQPVVGTPDAKPATGHTLLLIAGEYKATSASAPVQKHFRVKIDHDPTAGVDNRVLANYIYKLTVKITGEGSENEDDYELNAHVAATIDVAPWNVVVQNEDDVN